MEKQRCYGCMKQKTRRVCEYCGFDENTSNAPHQLPTGTVLQGRYLIGRVLGQGGFGITYLGWDSFLDVPVAIKEYFPSGMVMRESARTIAVTSIEGQYGPLFENNRERFLREAKTLAKFSNVSEIVHILNLFMDNNTAYIVMEYVDGITMKDYVRSRGGRITAQETFAILRPVMEALGKVHEAGLVHRDISPDNIMMLPDGSAKLLDFGAVRDVGDADVDKALTKSTEAILKHGFAPIEQYQSRGGLGPWTDVYALCATIYYCLTGRVPADAPLRVMGEAEVDWSQVAGVTDNQAAVLEKGMSLAPKTRIRTVAELYEGLFGGSAPVPGTVHNAVEQMVKAGPAPQNQGEADYPVGTLPLADKGEDFHTAPVSRPGPQNADKAPAKAPVFPVEETVQQPQPSKSKLPGLIVAAVILVALIGGVMGFRDRDKGSQEQSGPELSSFTAGSLEDIVQRDSYTASDAELAASGDTVVATAGEKWLTSKRLTNTGLRYYYWSQVNAYVTNYGDYLSLLGLDGTQPLDAQSYGEQTWQQYFLTNALENWYFVQCCAIEAESVGFRMGSSWQEARERSVSSMETYATLYGYSSAEEYLTACIGAPITMEAYEELMDTFYLGSAYYNHMSAQFVPTETDLETYFSEHESAFAEEGITRNMDEYYVNVRHILVETKAEAEEVLQQWLAGGASEESFAELAEAFSTDPGSNSVGGLYEGVYPGQMVESFNNWCFDAARKTGDYGVVESEYGYHVMYFSGRVEPWRIEAKQGWIHAQQAAMLETLTEKYPLAVDISAIGLPEYILSDMIQSQG